MEQKINREIMETQETIAMGLTLRQMVFGGAALVSGFLIGFFGRETLGEATSWVCILVAAPFAAIGFLRWHGMPAEQAAMVWLRYALSQKRLKWVGTNTRYDLHLQYLAMQAHGGKKKIKRKGRGKRAKNREANPSGAQGREA